MSAQSPRWPKVDRWGFSTLYMECPACGTGSDHECSGFRPEVNGVYYSAHMAHAGDAMHPCVVAERVHYRSYMERRRAARMVRV